MENYYKTLGLPDYCNDQDQIKKAYRTQVKYYHPDSKNVSPEIAEEQTRKINAAYDILSDPNKKAQYDNQLRYGASNPYQSYSNQTNNQTYSQANPEDFFRQAGFYGSPFGFYRTYSSNGTNRRRTNPILRIIITYLVLSFLFRMCSYARYSFYDDFYYGDEYYDERYHEDYYGEKGSAKLNDNCYVTIC